MKKYILLLALVFGFQFAKAQDFIATEKYTVVDAITTKQQEYNSTTLSVVKSEDTSKKVATLKITDIDLFDEIEITVLNNPNLENIHEVIKVELTYIACCANSESYYYLATKDGDFVSLPSIENVYCDIPQATLHYIFPNQKYGQEDTILTTAINYTESYKIKNIEILKSFAWNNDDFDSKDAITALQ